MVTINGIRALVHGYGAQKPHSSTVDMMQSKSVLYITGILPLEREVNAYVVGRFWCVNGFEHIQIDPRHKLMTGVYPCTEERNGTQRQAVAGRA